MTIKGYCHCSATQFEVPQMPNEAKDCNCTFCSKRGALWSYYPLNEFKLLTSRDRVSTYQWNSFAMEHHHCSICGCSTYSEGPTWDLKTGIPDFTKKTISINARLLENIDLEKIKIIKNNGKAY